MRAFLRVLSLFYGVQLSLSAAGWAGYCSVAERPFADPFSADPGGGAQFILWLVALPQGGIGLLLVYFGLTAEQREKFAAGLQKLLAWLATL